MANAKRGTRRQHDPSANGRPEDWEERADHAYAEVERQLAVDRLAERRRLYAEAEQRVEDESARRALPPWPSGSLYDELAEPITEEVYAVDDMALADGNVLIAAL